MAQAYFPAGTQIGGFVIKTFLKQNRLGCTYLAVDSANSKYRLTILNAQPEKLLEQDILLWTQSPETGIQTDIRFMREPVPCIISPCVTGLTLEECKWADISISLQEAVDLLCQIEQIRRDLTYRGAEDSFISMESILLTSEKHLVLQRDNLFFSGFSSIRRRLADAVFELAEPVPGISTEKIKKHFLSLPGEEITIRDPQFKDKTYISPRIRKFRRNLLIIAAAATGIFLLAWVMLLLVQNIQMTAPEVEQYQITANHHSNGPVIHAGKGNAEDSVNPFAGKSAIDISPEKPGALKIVPGQSENPVRKESAPVKLKKKIRQIFSPRPAPARLAEPPIIDAVRAGDIQMVKHFISRNADVNCLDSQGNTPMYYAVKTDWMNMISVLHRAGAKITQKEISVCRSVQTQRFLARLTRQSEKVPGSVTPAKPAAKEWVKAPYPQLHISLEQAKTAALQKKKKIILLFIGPSGNTQSKILRNLLLKPEEIAFLNRYAEIVYIDFSRTKSLPEQQRNYNTKLLRTYSGSNLLPLIVILDHRGDSKRRFSDFTPPGNFIRKLHQKIK